MTDCCYVQLEFRKSDLPILEKHLGKGFWDDEIKIGRKRMEVGRSEANYGWYDPLHEAAKEGAVFIGWNADGDNYGEGEFVSVEGEYHDFPTYEHRLVVPVNKNGEVSEKDLEAARAFLDRKKEALKILRS